jgi:hypothetical protein
MSQREKGRFQMAWYKQKYLLGPKEVQLGLQLTYPPPESKFIIFVVWGKAAIDSLANNSCPAERSPHFGK